MELLYNKSNYNVVVKYILFYIDFKNEHSDCLLYRNNQNLLKRIKDIVLDYIIVFSIVVIFINVFILGYSPLYNWSVFLDLIIRNNIVLFSIVYLVYFVLEFIFNTFFGRAVFELPIMLFMFRLIIKREKRLSEFKNALLHFLNGNIRILVKFLITIQIITLLKNF